MTHHRRLACLLAVGLALAPGAATAEEPVPRAAVAAPVHDFGAVEQGAEVQHVFRVRNVGGAALRIDRVQGGCACTVGAATGEPVMPGEEAWVTVTLDTRKLAGRTAKRVTVHTNDPVVPAFAVTLTGVVLTELVLRPESLYLGRVARGTTARRELTVEPGRPGGTATVLRAEVSSPYLRAWVEGNPAVGPQRVVVELDPDAPVGRFTEEVVLRTSSPSQPVLGFKVFGTVEAGRQSRAGDAGSSSAG